MDDIVSQLKADLNTHFNKFLIHVAKRYRVDIKKLFADFERYQSGTLEILEDSKASPCPPSVKEGLTTKGEPCSTAKKIKKLVGEEDSFSDEHSEVKTKLKPQAKSSILDSSDDGTASDENTVSLDCDTQSEQLSSSEEDIDINVRQSTRKSRVIEEPESDDDQPSVEATESDEDDEPSESEPKPKKVVKTKGTQGNKKTEKNGQKSVTDLSDTPRVLSDAKIPKGTKFLKGTNMVVVKGKVVATVGKNGFSKLNARNLKTFETPTYSKIKYDVWDKEKINKHFK